MSRYFLSALSVIAFSYLPISVKAESSADEVTGSKVSCRFGYFSSSRIESLTVSSTVLFVPQPGGFDSSGDIGDSNYRAVTTIGRFPGVPLNIQTSLTKKIDGADVAFSGAGYSTEAFEECQESGEPSDQCTVVNFSFLNTSVMVDGNEFDQVTLSCSIEYEDD